ncbi:hypothetical protein IGG49_004851, partial [Escherichia coli]|nr:hypothetical protein [Escherichia coli]
DSSSQRFSCIYSASHESRAGRGMPGLQEASGGELLYDPKVYDEYRKTKRAGRLNNENHS